MGRAILFRDDVSVCGTMKKEERCGGPLGNLTKDLVAFTCSNKLSRSSTSLFNLISEETRKTWLRALRALCLSAQCWMEEAWAFRLAELWWRDYTRTTVNGEEFSQGRVGWLPRPCCLVRGRRWLHANRLIFYVGLACKSARAKQHCNTRAHRLLNLASSAGNKHRVSHEATSEASDSSHHVEVLISRFWSASTGSELCCVCDAQVCSQTIHCLPGESCCSFEGNRVYHPLSPAFRVASRNFLQIALCRDGQWHGLLNKED